MNRTFNVFKNACEQCFILKKIEDPLNKSTEMKSFYTFCGTSFTENPMHKNIIDNGIKTIHLWSTNAFSKLQSSFLLLLQRGLLHRAVLSVN